MNRCARNTIIGAILLTGSAALALHGLHTQVRAEYPKIDPKIVRKAYNRVLYKAVSGQYSDLTMSEENIRALFLAEVELLDPAFFCFQ